MSQELGERLYPADYVDFDVASGVMWVGAERVIPMTEKLKAATPFDRRSWTPVVADGALIALEWRGLGGHAVLVNPAQPGCTSMTETPCSIEGCSHTHGYFGGASHG